jgi:hypothetical protein
VYYPVINLGFFLSKGIVKFFKIILNTHKYKNSYIIVHVMYYYYLIKMIIIIINIKLFCTWYIYTKYQ